MFKYRKLFVLALVMSFIMAVVAPASAQSVQPTATPTNTPDTSWRVRIAGDGSYGPELGLSRPGVGTSDNQVATMVGYKLVFQTAQGEVVLDGGCQQAVLPPNTYARNAGGQDWGYQVWDVNTAVTESINEIGVLSWELAKQQIDMEGCFDHPDTVLMAHIWVVTQDPNNSRLVNLTPWREYRRESGENHQIMFFPGDRVVGWHIGLGMASDNNLCDGGGCLLNVAPAVGGWVGGGAVNPWDGEVEGMTPISRTRILRVLRTLGN